jgi:UDP-N-acetylmuramoyl-tripeptide--D-alanyl-D-alanine ligase
LTGGTIRLIDESYNANPTSMMAALANLGHAAARRRIAILGDMLELGPEGMALHAGLANAIEEARADLVFLCGQQMAALWERIPQNRRGAYGAKSANIVEPVLSAVEEGDVVLVKGSFGSRMGVVVEALKARAA